MSTKLTKIVLYEPQETDLLPVSKIKSPGELLKQVKTEWSVLLTNRSATSFNLATDRSDRTNQINYEASANALRPLKTNSMDSEAVFSLGLSSQKVLKSYNISLKSALSSKMTSLGVSYIIPELSRLPESFIRKLNITIVFTDKADAEKYSFNTHDVSNEVRVTDKLYNLIFQAFIATFPEILRLWRTNNTPRHINHVTFYGQEEEEIKEIQHSFFALMQNKTYPKSKLDVTKLKELLIQFDSDGFSADWFKNRSRHLKKGLKVSFGIDEGDIVFPTNRRTMSFSSGFNK